LLETPNVKTRAISSEDFSLTNDVFCGVLYELIISLKVRMENFIKQNEIQKLNNVQRLNVKLNSTIVLGDLE